MQQRSATRRQAVGTRPGRAEASAIIWQWAKLAASETSPHNYSAQRRRGSLQAAFGVAAGGLFLWIGWSRLAWGVFTTAALLLMSALLSPGGVYATLDRLARSFAQRLGRILMWSTMVPVFYLFFFPFGTLFRRGRRDRLKRFFQPDAPTYWEPHAGPTAATKSHASQF
jgi:hypothetical protein